MNLRLETSWKASHPEVHHLSDVASYTKDSWTVHVEFENGTTDTFYAIDSIREVSIVNTPEQTYEDFAFMFEEDNRPTLGQLISGTMA